jgi:polar amino acid transport system substrate-binding protein
MIRRTGLFFAMLVGMAVVMPAQADKLDDIIASGKLRCAVVLDFPPMGSRDEKNNPVGYDVDTCNDLAAALGVKPEYVETPFPDRIPALISGRADVGVASTSDTLKRAQTIGFSIPYFAFKMVVLTRKGLGISTYQSLKGRKTGSVSGTFKPSPSRRTSRNGTIEGLVPRLPDRRSSSSRSRRARSRRPS